MNKTPVILGVILGLVFAYVGYIYASHSAGMLPAYFPGYSAGASNVHVKHSIAAFVLAAISFVYAWFKSAPKAS